MFFDRYKSMGIDLDLRQIILWAQALPFWPEFFPVKQVASVWSFVFSIILKAERRYVTERSWRTCSRQRSSLQLLTCTEKCERMIVSRPRGQFRCTCNGIITFRVVVHSKKFLVHPQKIPKNPKYPQKIQGFFGGFKIRIPHLGVNNSSNSVFIHTIFIHKILVHPSKFRKNPKNPKKSKKSEKI